MRARFSSLTPTRQRVEKSAVVIAALLLVVLVLIPPWKSIRRIRAGYPTVYKTLWHSPLWHPPSGDLFERMEIDMGRLLLEGTAISLLAAGAIYAARR